MQPSGEPVSGCLEVSSEVLMPNEPMASEGLDSSPSDPQSCDFDTDVGPRPRTKFFPWKQSIPRAFPTRESFTVVRTCVAGL